MFRSIVVPARGFGRPNFRGLQLGRPARLRGAIGYFTSRRTVLVFRISVRIGGLESCLREILAAGALTIVEDRTQNLPET